MSKAVKAVIAVVLVVVLGVGIYFLISSYISNQKYRPFTDVEGSAAGSYGFIELVEDPIGEGGKIDDSRQIKKIYYDGYRWYGYTDARSNTYAYWTVGPNPYDANSKYNKEWAAEHKIVLEYGDPNAGAGWSNFIYIAILIVGVVAFFLILRATSGGGGKVMNFGKTKAKVSTNLKVRFSATRPPSVIQMILLSCLTV